MERAVLAVPVVSFLSDCWTVEGRSMQSYGDHDHTPLRAQIYLSLQFTRRL
jgi:hypothetical protein